MSNATTKPVRRLAGVASVAGNASGRPWALTVLWVCLMGPLSLAGIALQPYTPVPDTVFPLVMVGPTVAALICRVVVPRWFPPVAPRAGAARFGRSLVAIGAASAVFVAVLIPFGSGRPMIIPDGMPNAAAVLAVVGGLAAASLCEEIGYRGVMYRALSARLRPILAVLVNSVFFGLCHMQYFGEGGLPVLLFVLGTVFMGVAMVAVWAGSWRQRILVAAILHAAVNISMQLVGIGADRLVDFVGMAIALGAAAAVAVALGWILGMGDFTYRSPGRT